MANNKNRLIIPDSLKELIDVEQQKAVSAPISDICVTAVAGSGKTRVLTCRTATLIYNGEMEDSIILVTFTNKAANEIIRRVGELLPSYQNELLYGTFHSICCHFLRKYCDKLGLKENFGIVSPQEQVALMQNFRNEHIHIYFNDDESKLPSGAILSEIYSGAINKNITFNDYIRKDYANKIPVESIENIIDFFESYEKYKEVNNKLDYDGMLLCFYDLLYYYPEIKEEINSQYKHILVDEYQDINWLQHDILKLLNANSSIFAIGDAAQCIYQFRGSEPKYITDFKNTYPNASLFTLSKNYRSCHSILKLAENSINHNEFNIVINSVFKNNYLPEVYSLPTPEAEAEFIVSHILENYRDELNNVAILVRTSRQQKLIIDTFKAHNVNLHMSKDDISEYKCIKRLIPLMIFCENTNDSLAFKDALLSFNGVGEKLATEAVMQYKTNGNNISKIKVKQEALKNALARLSKLEGKVSKEGVESRLERRPASLISLIMETFLKSELSAKEIKVISALKHYIENYKSTIAVYDAIKKGDINIFAQNNSVSVLTMHSAKGLEWEYVYIPFITNNVFPKCPYWELDKNTDNIKSERNLFYVALTRAKERLFITYSTESANPKYHAGPSLFIKELDKKLYKAPKISKR